MQSKTIPTLPLSCQRGRDCFRVSLAGQREWERTELCPVGFKPGVGSDLTGLAFLLALRSVFIFFCLVADERASKLGSIRGSPNPLRQYGQTDDGLKIGFWGEYSLPLALEVMIWGRSGDLSSSSPSRFGHAGCAQGCASLGTMDFLPWVCSSLEPQSMCPSSNSTRGWGGCSG